MRVLALSRVLMRGWMILRWCVFISSFGIQAALFISLHIIEVILVQYFWPPYDESLMFFELDSTTDWWGGVPPRSCWIEIIVKNIERVNVQRGMFILYVSVIVWKYAFYAIDISLHDFLLHLSLGFLDPEKKLFSHRILSRDECIDPFSKTGNLRWELIAAIDDYSFFC